MAEGQYNFGLRGDLGTRDGPPTSKAQLVVDPQLVKSLRHEGDSWYHLEGGTTKR